MKFGVQGVRVVMLSSCVVRENLSIRTRTLVKGENEKLHFLHFGNACNLVRRYLKKMFSLP